MKPPNPTVTHLNCHQASYSDIAAQLRHYEQRDLHFVKVIQSIYEAFRDGDTGTAKMIAQLAYLDTQGTPPASVIQPVTDAIFGLRTKTGEGL